MNATIHSLRTRALAGLRQGLRVVKGFPESVIAMRFLGFAAAGGIIGILAVFNKLSFDLGPAPIIFASFLLVTTILFAYFKNLRSEHRLLTLLMMDMIGISLLIYFYVEIPSVLMPLYLISLTSAMLLSQRTFFLLGLFGLTSYILVVYFAVNSPDRLAPVEVTRISLLALVIGIAMAQNWYSTYLLREHEKQTLRSQDRFLFTTVHDLRGPFALIRILAEKYESGRSGTIEELQEDMEAIDENISSAMQLLEDLLLLAKGKNIRIRKTAVDLPHLIKRLLEHWQTAIRQKDIQVIYESGTAPRRIMGDQQRTGYALDNIIGNGIKYNVRGGTLRIWHQVREGFLETIIEDTGCGISPEHLAKVFTPYFREKKDPGIPGTGLGLYSAKQFIEKMGGDIRVASTKQGTRFTVSLPLKK